MSQARMDKPEQNPYDTTIPMSMLTIPTMAKYTLCSTQLENKKLKSSLKDETYIFSLSAYA